MNDKNCQDILERLAKLEQKTDDLEEFVKNILLERIDKMENCIYEKMDGVKITTEKRFKWMLGLFVLFFISTVIPLIIMVIRG